MFGKPFPVTYRYAEEVLERQVKDDTLLVRVPVWGMLFSGGGGGDVVLPLLRRPADSSP